MRELNLPTEWNELSRQQFAAVSDVLFTAFMEKYPARIVRLKTLEALIGIELVRDLHQKIGCRQKLAEYTRFIFKVTVNKEIAAVLSPELAENLKWCLPEEIDDKQWKKEIENVSQLLDPTIDFNLSIPQNLLPEILINRESYAGPVFTIDKNGILKTDMTAGEYFDASEYFSIFGKTGDVSCLANVAACLYRKNRKSYNTFEAQQRAEIFKSVSPKYLKSVWLIMLSWKEFFYKHPVFGMLFSEAETEGNKIDIGSSALIYNMSKDGYGSISEISNMHIDDFFAIQVSHLRDAVNTLRSGKKNNADISKELKIPLSTVLKL